MADGFRVVRGFRVGPTEPIEIKTKKA